MKHRLQQVADEITEVLIEEKVAKELIKESSEKTNGNSAETSFQGTKNRRIGWVTPSKNKKSKNQLVTPSKNKKSKNRLVTPSKNKKSKNRLVTPSKNKKSKNRR